MTLERTVTAFCEAVSAADADRVQQLSEAHAYHDSLSPEHLVRHAERSGLGLIQATRFFVGDAHATVEAAWHRDGRPTGRTWLMFCERDGLWRFTGRTDSEQVGQAYVHLKQDEAPSMDRWPAGEDVKRMADACLAAATGGPPPGSGPLWDELLEPVEGDMGVRLGATAQVDALARALVEVEWYESDDPDFADTTRCGVFEQTDGGLTLIAVRYLAVCRSLLVGLTFDDGVQAEGALLGMSGVTAPLSEVD